MKKYFIKVMLYEESSYNHLPANFILELSYEELDIQHIKTKIEELLRLDRESYKCKEIVDICSL